MVEVGGRLWRGGRVTAMVTAQSRQSAKLFLMSSELGLPHPLVSVFPLLCLGGGGYTLACERGGGGVQVPARGQTLWYWYAARLYSGLGRLHGS